MSQHVPEDLLQAFVEGEVGEQLAIHIAEHLDACPACATRATGLEPLAAAFAAIRDPIPPPDLARRVLAGADEPDRLPFGEIAIGLALLVCAALLAAGIDHPLKLAADVGVFLNALEVLGRGLATSLSSFQLALALLTAATLTGGLVTLHYAALPSQGLLRRVP